MAASHASNPSSRSSSSGQRKTLVAFGGESPEHEVSVITALQAMDVLREAGANEGGSTSAGGDSTAPRSSGSISTRNNSTPDLLPFYVSKQGEWFTGEALFDLDSYQDLGKLTASLSRCTFVKDPLLGACLEVKSSKGFSLFSSKPVRIPLNVALMAFHGSAGENGAFQGLFESIGLPYTGSAVLSSALGMNKVVAKKLAVAAGVKVVPWVDFSEEEWVAQREELEAKAAQIGFPLVIKPVHLGSSIGISTAKNVDEFRKAVEMCLRFDAHVMAEKKIEPLLEVNCSVLGIGADARSSVCERPLGSDEILSFADKYLSGGASSGSKSSHDTSGGVKNLPGGTSAGGSKGMASLSRVIPADISEELTRQIQQHATTLFREFECSGVARFDFILQGTTENASEVYFNEVNTIPGSFSFYLWKESGVNFSQLLLELISIAKRAHNRRSGRSFSFENNLLKHRKTYGSKKLGK